jgi:hypothetical protein
VSRWNARSRIALPGSVVLATGSALKGKARGPSSSLALEVRRDVVLRAAQPRLQRSYEWISADLNESGSAAAFLHHDRRRASDQRFFGNSVTPLETVASARFRVGPLNMVN